jgi:glycosyltransferase involved in cell wall biosynthesis
VPEGRAGHVVPVGDAPRLAERVTALLADEPLRSRLGEQARRWAAESFSLQRLASETGDVYEAAVRRKRAAQPRGAEAARPRPGVTGPRA